jgi:hypothetical protein
VKKRTPRAAAHDQLANVKAEEFRKQTLAEAQALTKPLFEVLGGLTEETRALRLTNERMLTESYERRQIDHKMISEFNERRLIDYRTLEALKGLTDELAALRTQRAKGGNGHAAQDDLTNDDTDGKPE